MKLYNSLGFTCMIMLFTTSLFAWNEGDRVLAKWKDKVWWYPATISQITDSAYILKYDDGDTGDVSVESVKKINWKVGSRVNCNWKKTGKYFWGKITRKSGDSIHISYDDGDQEDAKIGQCRSK